MTKNEKLDKKYDERFIKTMALNWGVTVDVMRETMRTLSNQKTK